MACDRLRDLVRATYRARVDFRVEIAEVLVTVKAYPQLSKKAMSEVVCVAGVRLDRGRPEWIRLFPVPYRDLPAADRFVKYEVVKLKVRRGADSRPETYLPDFEGMERTPAPIPTGRNQNWSERSALIGDLIGQTTMCRLYRENEGGGPAPSLGLIKPAEVLEVIVERNEGFNRERQQLAELVAQETLLGPAKAALEPSPYVVKYRYRCLEDRCRTHTQSLIDWEVGEAGRKWPQSYPQDEIPGRIRDKFLDQLCGPERDTHFYVGNQRLHLQSFLVLGVWWPRIPKQDVAANLELEGLF